MNRIRSFLRSRPLVLALLGIVTIWFSIRVLPVIDLGGITLGVHEAIAACVVLIVYAVCVGKRDLKPDPSGFGYGFRLMRYLYIIQFVLAGIGVISLVSALVNDGNTAPLINLLNAVIACAFVGIVEEFTFRGMLFGGLVSLFGRSKKSVIWAAILSGIAFGFIHVANEVFTGQIGDAASAAQVAGKTIQTGLSGFVLAVIYFRTRSIWAAAALHGLDDLLLFLFGVAQEGSIGTYVTQSSGTGDPRTSLIPIGVYLLFSLMMIPAVVRAARGLNREPEPYVLPGEERFLPRKLSYEAQRGRKRR